MGTSHAFLLESCDHHNFLLESVGEKTIAGDARILFSTTEESFPFVVRNVVRGMKENILVLSGVAETRRRGRHFVRIEYVIDARMGVFLQ